MRYMLSAPNKNILFIVFFVLCMNLLGQSLIVKDTSNCKPLYIVGKISNSRNKEITLRVIDNYITWETKNYTSAIDSSGTFIWKFKIDKPYEAYFKWSNGNNFLFLEPNDSIHINFDGLSLNKTLQFSGRGSNNNNVSFLIQNNYRYLLNPFKIEPLISCCQYRDTILMQLDHAKKVFNSFITKYDISPLFKYYMENEIKYVHLNQILRYNYLINQNNSKSDQLKDRRLTYATSDCFDFLNFDDFNNDSLIFYPTYGNVCTDYLFYKDTIDNDLDDGIFNICNRMKQTFKGKTRDFMIARLLYGRFEHDQTYYDAYADFLKTCQYPDILEILTKGIVQKRKAYIGDVLDTKLSSTAGEDILLGKLIEKHKGKVLYIDIWATSCSACIKEFPFADKMRDKFKNKEIEILYLSMDSNQIRWLNFLKKREMIGNNQYIVKDGLNSSLCKQYLISGLPRYMLISTTGQIISVDFTKPSDTVTYQKILNELNSIKN